MYVFLLHIAYLPTETAIANMFVHIDVAGDDAYCSTIGQNVKKGGLPGTGDTLSDEEKGISPVQEGQIFSRSDVKLALPSKQ